MQSNDDPLTLFFDGDCPVCRTAMGHATMRRRSRRAPCTDDTFALSEPRR